MALETHDMGGFHDAMRAAMGRKIAKTFPATKMKRADPPRLRARAKGQPNPKAGLSPDKGTRRRIAENRRTKLRAKGIASGGRRPRKGKIVITMSQGGFVGGPIVGFDPGVAAGASAVVIADRMASGQIHVRRTAEETRRLVDEMRIQR